tara:strand:- start:116 stop:466 length:351 start_codon:yes stop_codon:yes gene_type:complete
MKIEKNRETQVAPLLLAGQILTAWRLRASESQRGMARRLGVKQPTWRNVELGIKPPGRVLFIRMILLLKLKKKQITTLSILYHYYDIGLTVGVDVASDALYAFDLEPSDIGTLLSE